MPRMRVLSTVEQEAFDTPPDFNSAQRKQFFSFSSGILHLADERRTPFNKLYFLLSVGYFNFSKRFFPVRSFRRRDIEYVAKHAGIVLNATDIGRYDKQSLRLHQNLILNYYAYQPFDRHARDFLALEIETMARLQQKPRLIFWRCLDLLIRKKIQLPGYFAISELILKAINQHKKELSVRIEQTLSSDVRVSIDDLFVQPGVSRESPASKTAAYKLTLLKKLSQSTRPTRVKERVEDLSLLKEFYERLQPTLSTLSLDYEGIRYYATSVIKSEIFQVARKADEDRYLHVIAFIAYQYYRLQDNLVDVLLASLQSNQNSAQREHKEQCYANRGKSGRRVKELIVYLDEYISGSMTAIREITENAELTDTMKIDRIRSLLEARGAQQNQYEKELALLKENVENESDSTGFYRILETKSIRIQNRVSPIIKAITFRGEPNVAHLLYAIQYFKEKDGLIDKNAPDDFLKAMERKAIYDGGGQFRISLYKALLFTYIQRGIKSGSLNLEHSFKYRPIEDYLISRSRWDRDREALLERSGLKSFAEPIKVLSELSEALYRQYEITNQHILDGSNPFISFNKNGFSIKTPKQEEVESETLQNFFPERRYVPLLEVLATVNRYSGFLDELHNWRQRYHRKKPPLKAFYASIIGLGCEIGTKKMGRISQHIAESDLDRTVNWYFSPEGIHAANDRILRLINRLELPNIYRRSQENLHTSSDGQKFEVRHDSLNANYSFKYFGKGQGVSVYSFIDERNLLWHSVVFSAAERESAYVIDGLMHNDVVKSDIHSTDSHGFSEAIFGATHMIEVSYAPRLKNLKRQKLYIFKNRNSTDRSSWKIVPSAYIETDLIEENWDDILRLITTVKLKEVTASDLFRRLNSYSRQHPLYRALKAFGRIIKSMFILRYIDDVGLRQAIEKQLNKIEQSHNLTRAVSVGNPRELVYTEKYEQEIAEGCKRLIKNAITCWNYLYLSQKLEEADNPENYQVLLHAIENGSISIWRHINLLGEYDFSDEKLQDSVGIKPPKFID